MKRFLSVFLLVWLAGDLRAAEAQAELPAPDQAGANRDHPSLTTPPAKPKKIRKPGEKTVRTGGLFGDLAKEKKPLQALDPRQPANLKQDVRNVSTNSAKPPTAGFKLLTIEF